MRECEESSVTDPVALRLLCWGWIIGVGLGYLGILLHNSFNALKSSDLRGR